jgi:hypothetical protein
MEQGGAQLKTQLEQITSDVDHARAAEAEKREVIQTLKYINKNLACPVSFSLKMTIY